MNRTSNLFAGLVALLALLTACGGDDDGGVVGGPTAATLDFTADNYVVQTDAAAQALLDTRGILTPISPALGASSGDVALGGPSIAGSSRVAGHLLGRSIGGALAAGAREHAKLTDTEDLPCDSGRLVLTSNYASDEVTTVGDSLRLVSDNCRLSGQTVAGAMTMSVTSVSTTATAETGSLGIDFESFGVAGTISVNGRSQGSYSATEDSIGVEIDFAGVPVNVRGRSERWYQKGRFEQAGFGAPTLSYSGFVTVGDQFVKVDQIAPFVLSVRTGGLQSGMLQFTDRDGGRVRVVPRATRFEYQYFEANNQTNTPDRVTSEGLAYGG
jgi:hypothetical protein